MELGDTKDTFEHSKENLTEHYLTGKFG